MVLRRGPAAAAVRVMLGSLAGLIFSVGPLVLSGAALAQSEPNSIVALAYDDAEGLLVKATPNALYRSADAGESWVPVAVPLNDGGSISAVGIGADGAGIFVAGPGIGVLHSEDGGASWEVRGTGLPSLDVIALSGHADQPDTVYVYVPEQGIYRSRDAGATWQLMDRGPAGIRQLVHSNLPGSMETGWLYAATDQGVEISMDCFCLWRNAGVPTVGVLGVAYGRARPELVYAAAGDGLFRSANGGLDWEKAEAPPGALTAIAVTPNGLYAAADGRVFRSTDEAATWEEVGE